LDTLSLLVTVSVIGWGTGKTGYSDMAKAGTIDGRMRVAVVDDDSDTRLFFRDILQSETAFSFAGGFSNANEAITGIPRLQPDLVLMDISLPGMNGIECMKRLMRLMPQLSGYER
jgi:CheY-like chemotaxis protein